MINTKRVFIQYNCKYIDNSLNYECDFCDISTDYLYQISKDDTIISICPFCLERVKNE